MRSCTDSTHEDDDTLQVNCRQRGSAIRCALSLLCWSMSRYLSFCAGRTGWLGSDCSAGGFSLASSYMYSERCCILMSSQPRSSTSSGFGNGEL